MIVKMNKLSPYPTFGEVLRQIFLAFDIKFSSKKLDEAAQDKYADARLIDRLIEENIDANAGKYIDEHMASFLSAAAKFVVEDYLACVGLCSADGLTRKQMMPLLMRELFPFIAQNPMQYLLGHIGGPAVSSLVASDTSAVSVVLSWLDENSNGWHQFIKVLDKDEKDKIHSWRQGNKLPSLLSINDFNGDQLSVDEWSQAKSLLMLTRAIDYASQHHFGGMLIESIREIIWSVKSDTSFEEDVYKLQQELYVKMKPVEGHLAYVQQGLKPTGTRAFDQKETYGKLLEELRVFLHEINAFELTGYWVDWHQARWFLYSSDLDSACDFYKSAFDGCLYSAGKGQQELIFEALIVASAQSKPDKNHLKKLKNAAITFGYDLSLVFDAKDKYSTPNIIEDWEIELLRSHFNQMFPEEAFFDSPIELSSKAKAGPLCMTFDEMDAIKPDYRNPDRVIKVGSWNKRMPQLVWFTLYEKFDVVKRLIEEGADVDKLSESGESALTIALEIMNLAAFDCFRSLDRRFFDLISRQPHKKETVNKCTTKKRLLPLLTAVKTGKKDIVLKILAMGADVNGRGHSDNTTPLNACIKLIGMVKNPTSYWLESDRMEQTPERLATLKRDVGWLAGSTLEQQSAFLNSHKNDPDRRKIGNIIRDICMERVMESISIDSMREIAKMLIDHGADPNAEHEMPIKGYTPFMLAVELDEADLVRQMLRKGGDPYKSYFCDRKGQTISSYGIALGFESQKVMQTLPGINQQFG